MIVNEIADFLNSSGKDTVNVPYSTKIWIAQTKKLREHMSEVFFSSKARTLDSLNDLNCAKVPRQFFVSVGGMEEKKEFNLDKH